LRVQDSLRSKDQTRKIDLFRNCGGGARVARLVHVANRLLGKRCNGFRPKTIEFSRA